MKSVIARASYYMISRDTTSALRDINVPKGVSPTSSVSTFAQSGMNRNIVSDQTALGENTCSKSTIKTLENAYGRYSSIFIVDFEPVVAHMVVCKYLFKVNS